MDGLRSVLSNLKHRIKTEDHVTLTGASLHWDLTLLTFTIIFSFYKVAILVSGTMLAYVVISLIVITSGLTGLIWAALLFVKR